MAKSNILKLKNAAKVKVSVVTITPDMARKMLVTNINNRNLNREIVRAYAQALELGRWQLTGESIIIADTGRLLDGQHRLEAIVLADIAMDCVLVEGISEDAFRTIDTGSKRSAGQIMRIINPQEKYVSALSAATGFLEQYNLQTQGQSRRTPAWRRLEVLEENPGLRDSAAAIYNSHWIKSFAGSSGVAVGMHYLTTEKHGAKAHDFWEKLDHGTDLETGSPILSLRDWLISYKMAPGQQPWPELFSAYKNIWNAFITDQAMYGIKRETSYERTASWEVQ